MRSIVLLAAFLAAFVTPAWATVNLATCGCTLQQALDTGEPVYAPAGVYTVTGTVKIDPHAVLYGDAEWKTIFNFTGTGNGMEPRDPTQFTDFVTLHDFSWHGTEESGSVGIYMPSSRHWDLRRVQVRDWGEACVKIYGQRTLGGGLNPGDSTYNYFEHVRLGVADYPLILTGTVGSPRINGGTSNINTFVHLRVFSARTSGMALTQGSSNRFYNASLVANTYQGAFIGWYGNSFHGLVAENNGGWGVLFGTASEVHGNRIFGVHNGGSNGNGLTNASGSNLVY